MKNGGKEIDSGIFERIGRTTKRRRRRRSTQASQRTFVESFEMMKKDALNGKLSLETFDTYRKAADVLQLQIEAKERVTEIADMLLQTWERQAEKGEFDLNAIETYILASNKLSIPVAHHRLRLILDIAHKAGAHGQYERRYEMTDEEYVELLKAAADEYVRLDELERQGITEKALKEAVDRLAATAKFARVVGERTDNAQLCKSLSAELKKGITDYDYVVSAVEISGINDAVSTADWLILRELRLSALPPEEQEYLRKCGREHPESYLKLLIANARSGYEIGLKAKNIFDDGKVKIHDAARTLTENKKRKKTSNPTTAKPRKKRRICFGIAKIFEGVVTAGGDIASAVIGGGLAYLALPSTASSIMAIYEGLKSFRAE
jgi:hypothetical protein